MGEKKSVERQSKEAIRIPIPFEHAIAAALETKPEGKKGPKKKPQNNGGRKERSR
jgi:hypothetical protein